MTRLPKFLRLVPILFVKDLESEVDFYTGLGFEISYQGDEFPGFVGLESGHFDFGLQEKADFRSKPGRSQLRLADGNG